MPAQSLGSLPVAVIGGGLVGLAAAAHLVARNLPVKLYEASSGRSYRYYTCSTRARQGQTGCHGPAVQMDRLDEAVIDFLGSQLLAPERIKALMAPLLTHRESWVDRRRQHVAELRERADEAERKPRNLYEAVEDGMLASTDRMFGERVAELSTLREQAEIEADRVAAMVDRGGSLPSMQGRDPLGGGRASKISSGRQAAAPDRPHAASAD